MLFVLKLHSRIQVQTCKQTDRIIVHDDNSSQPKDDRENCAYQYVKIIKFIYRYTAKKLIR